MGADMARRKRNADGERGRRELADEARYVCADCGEEIVVPIDATAGASQSYVEDCPVCCHPQRITIEIDDDGSVRCWAEAE
jgi:hypothetical protein